MRFVDQSEFSVDFREFYIQRYKGFFIVPKRGVYIF